MGGKTADEIAGFEYDWLACDSVGQVAFFSTAGGGYAPLSFLEDPDAHDRAIEGLATLAPTTSAKLAPDVAEGLPNPWETAAERGVFSYDSDYTGGPYRLVGAPKTPIVVDALPIDIANVARRFTFRQVVFGKATSLPSEDIVRLEKATSVKLEK